jgi:hypothetical protein
MVTQAARFSRKSGTSPDSSIPAQTQRALMTLEWLARAECLSISGPSGTPYHYALLSRRLQTVQHRRVDLDTQAFSPSSSGVDGVELAPLDSMHHGLGGHAEGLRRIRKSDPALRCILANLRAQSVVDPDPPRAPGVICSPTMKPSLIH